MQTSVQITMVIKDEPLRDLLSLMNPTDSHIDVLNRGLFIYHRLMNEKNQNRTIKEFIREIKEGNNV